MRTAWLPLATVAVFCFESAPALAWLPAPSANIKPIVLLAVDTSGSMEYSSAVQGAESSDLEANKVPNCTPGNYGKSRFIVALEVLTGTYGGYSCTKDDRSAPSTREDYNYPVPHIVPFGTQAADGLLDLYQDRIKFGVMTFDTKPGATNDAAGGYSFGDGTESPANYGARSETAPTGRFVKPAASDDNATVVATNTAVQASLLSAVPYSGTPIAPLLRDAYQYFTTDPSLASFNPVTNTGDPYAACRPKYVLLVTDGVATLGEGMEGYQLSTWYAAKLLQAGVKVYVIGFNLPPSVSTLVDSIAAAGGTTKAQIANNPVELALSLGQVLSLVDTDVQSRTRMVITNATQNPEDQQYQFNAGWGMSSVPGQRKGYLEASVFRCQNACPDISETSVAGLCKVWSLAGALQTLGEPNRTVWTVIDGVRKDFRVGGEVTADALGLPTSGPLTDISPQTLENGTVTCGSSYLGDASDPAKRNAYRDLLIKFVRGAPDSCRGGAILGAIMHSSPAVAEPPSLDLTLASYRSFQSLHKNRPTMLYVGTHDGQLHAFRVDRENLLESQWGRELWAFIPNHLLKQVKNLPFQSRTLLDGPIVVRDVLMERNQSDLANPSQEAAKWKTVLVAGYRAGGRGYFALDVTDPEHPALMWELSNEGRWYVQNNMAAGGTSNEFENLGYSFSRPEIGVIALGTGFSAREIAVAVFGGGSGQGLGPGVGRGAFVVRLDTGEKLAEFSYANGNVFDAGSVLPNATVDADVIGAVTCQSTVPGTYLSRCFVGDRDGMAWRLDIGARNPANWGMEFFYDPYLLLPDPKPAPGSTKRAPAMEAPSLSFTSYTNQLVVTWASGDVDNVEETTHTNYVASVTEAPVTDSGCTQQCRSPAPDKANWVRFFTGGEKVMGTPLTYASVTYFTTFTPGGGTDCSPGTGALWGVDFVKHGATIHDLIPMLDADENAATVDWVDRKALDADAIPYGVTIVRRPACVQGMDFLTALSSGGFEASPLASLPASQAMLVVQTGTKAAASPGTKPPGANAQTPEVATAIRKLQAPNVSMFASSWGFVFD